MLPEKIQTGLIAPYEKQKELKSQKIVKAGSSENQIIELRNTQCLPFVSPHFSSNLDGAP